MIEVFLNSERETERFAAAFWRMLPAGSVVYLQGNLGAGKTSLVRGMLRAAGFDGAVKSPTYNLVEEYHLNGQNIFHFDLYRIQDPEELEWIGIDDYFHQQAICLIEWPSLGQGMIPQPGFIVELKIVPEGRQIGLRIAPSQQKKNLHLIWKNKDILL